MDALIQHICENGGQVWPLGAQIWPFDEAVHFTAKSFGPKLFGDCSPILGHAPGHWYIVKKGAIFVLRGQKTAKMAIFDEAMLITHKLFRSEVPGHHSPFLGQHPSHSDALIRHICENGGNELWTLCS